MKNSNTLYSLLVLIMAVAFTACKSSFVAKDFATAAHDHYQIAVLPAEMNYLSSTGNTGSYKKVDSQTREESLLFQQAMTTEILRHGSKGIAEVRIQVLPVNTIMMRLADAGLSMADCWRLDGKVLNEVLGVDALVATTITKDRSAVNASAIRARQNRSMVDNALDRAERVVKNKKQVHARFELINGGNGSVLWTAESSSSLDWRSQHEKILRAIAKSAVKNFPYGV